GPGSAGTPRHIGLIVTGTNCSAVDLVVSKIVGVAEDQIPTIIAAREKGIVKDLNEVIILGEPISKVTIRGFKLPASTDLEFGPKVMRGVIKDSVMVKPIEDRDTCTLCGECAEICPTAVITVGEKRLEIDYRRCISCFCCIEICPQGAMRSKKGLLASFLS
ncbi:MAG TPA: 4Fe-4S binding protein, partial [Nitrospiria bacterium]|nr:4Fe-4S binding protein [Nitrospiria bacterium]